MEKMEICWWQVMKKFVSIDEMRVSFNCYKMEDLKIFQKIFIIGACRGENAPKSYEFAMRGNEILHNNDGFLIIYKCCHKFQMLEKHPTIILLIK
ncbi:hypothetical protein RFI_00771 [Reticulomyxa filosa]|uniref:Caspase family p20 domain-containing protein n=1 Tax=Reticulomyxa filosa TaxID=46433 RepID=X6PDL2_RETFI|nr:hypothetical protein RFI_00771 [Reticulomyxa filosa]|eukprot:ETO36291.1 hypothetical protein RFI_00771 [Reticulomyxa filosa]